MSPTKTLIPVKHCIVTLSDEDLGEVTDNRLTSQGCEVEVAWARKKSRSWHRPELLRCGFREEMWVKVVSGSSNNEPEIGKIVQFRELGEQFQALVDFPRSGRRCWVPFQLLAREADLQERLIRGKFQEPNEAERFRLRCLAHGLEIWNENTGALSGLEIEPLPHQVSLVHHILASGHYNWLIADDVGLGKTIEVGLLINAHLQKQPDARILVVCPAGLTQQWQEELRFKFRLTEFEIYGKDFTIQYTDQWFRKRQVIASMDRLKHERHLEVIREVAHWDLIVFDEAHRLTRHERGFHYNASDRYELAQTLRGHTDSMLLLTATPHQGKDDLFRSLLLLLRPDLRRQINLLEQNRQMLLDMVIRNPKSEVRDWEGKKVFQGKEVRAIRIGAPPGLEDFTARLERYFRAGYEAARELGQKGMAIHFVMTVYRKLAASSIHSITEALVRRLNRLEGRTENSAPTPTEEADIRYLGEQEEGQANAASTFFPEEARRLRELISLGRQLVPSDVKLQQLLHDVIPQIQGRARSEKVVIFTEYRSTQEYLRKALIHKFGASSVVLIHGSMSMDDRRESIRSFEETAQFLISTEAGGEGINLQRRCHTMINYDIPWNPTRLIQRVGRLYRYGQQHPVVVFNLHSTDTLDARIVSEIYQRLERIVQDLSILGGDYDENYRDEVLGQLAELTDVESLFDHAYEKQSKDLQVEITEALTRAKEIYEQRKDIFSYFTTTLSPDAGGDLVLSPRHLREFVDGMIDYLEISIEDQTKDGKVVTIRMPEAIQQRLQLKRAQLTISFDRDRIHNPRIEVLDWNSSFLQALLRLAKSREFGGQVASVEALSGRSLVVSTLYWQNSFGRRTRRELSMALVGDDGSISINPSHLLEELLNRMEDGQMPELAERKLAFEEIYSGLNKRLAEVSGQFLHPEGLELLALATRGSDQQS